MSEQITIRLLNFCSIGSNGYERLSQRIDTRHRRSILLRIENKQKKTFISTETNRLFNQLINYPIGTIVTYYDYYDLVKGNERQITLDTAIHRQYIHSFCDRPAVEYADGLKEWYQRGELHRDGDKPAIEYTNGTRWWYQQGKLHRDDDKPAREYADGAKWWYQRGELHRDNDRPAIEYANGTKRWY